MIGGRSRLNLGKTVNRSPKLAGMADAQSVRSRAGLRILMVSIVDPVLSLSGAGTVTRGLLRVFKGPDLRATVECLATRPPSSQYHSLRQIESIARSFVYGMPAKAAYTFSRNFRDRVLERANREHFDLVILNGSDLLWLETVLPSTIPRLLIAHNIEHLLFAAQAKTLERSFPLLRPFLRWECRRMERFETAGIRSVRNAIFLSSVDASHPLAGALAKRTLVTPPLFSDSPARRMRPKAGIVEIGFLGNMAWWPNRQGLSWFLSNVFPHVGRNVHLNLFGQETQRYARGVARVTQHGPVDNLAEVWSRCDLMICPMHIRSGVCTKLAEAIYHGVPVLATSVATRGLPLTDDPCITVSDDAQDWIDHLTSPNASVGERISPTLSHQFAVQSHRETVQRFVRDVIREWR
jgi:glycosyltransferase involved in cell wall biosynthesis